MLIVATVVAFMVAWTLGSRMMNMQIDEHDDYDEHDEYGEPRNFDEFEESRANHPANRPTQIVKQVPLDDQPAAVIDEIAKNIRQPE